MCFFITIKELPMMINVIASHIFLLSFSVDYIWMYGNMTQLCHATLILMICIFPAPCIYGRLIFGFYLCVQMFLNLCMYMDAWLTDVLNVVDANPIHKYLTSHPMN